MNQPIRIVFRYPDAKRMFLSSSERDAGGAPVQIYTLATELAKEPDLAVYVWVDDLRKEKHVGGITLLPGRVPLTGRFPFIKRVLNKLRMMRVSKFAAEGIVIFTVSIDAGTAGLMKQLLARGAQVVYRFASDYAITSARDKLDGSEEFSAVLPCLDALVTQTNTQRKLLQESMGFDSVVIPSAFPVKQRAAPAHRDRQYDVFWVGQCRWYKRPWIAFDMARQFPDARFLIVMPEFEKATARALKSQLSSLPNIKLLDYVPPNEIQSYYDQSRIVLNTSMFEGYPNTLNSAGQAQAAYLSTTWESDEIFSEGGLGLCAKGDINLCYEQLEYLLAHPDVVEQMGRRSYEHLQTAHSVGKVVQEYKNLIRSM